MDAIKLLIEDHRRVDELFEKFESLSERIARDKIAEQIQQEVLVHGQEEEQVFYPAFQKATQDQDMLQHAMKEHIEMKELARRLTQDLSDQELERVVQQLKSVIKDHVEEEETEMFPKAREAMGEDQVNRLGDEIKSLKPKLMQETMRLSVTMAPESKVEQERK